MEFRALAFGAVFAGGGRRFPFPNPIQTREAETGNSRSMPALKLNRSHGPSITLQTVPSIIETTLTTTLN